MLRLLPAAVVALMLLAPPALAGDRALFNFLGYSEDGTYAAFEEFGEWDGVGGYYSHIYVVDLEDDSWVTGSPYLVDPDPNVETDTRPIAVVRAKALALAEAKLRELHIDVPAETIFLHGDGMGDERSKFVTFSSPSYLGTGETQNDATTLVLADTGGAPSDACAGDSNAVGFVLDLYDRGGKHTLHDDGNTPPPRSRGCTIDYSIYAVLAPLDGGSNVAILSVYTSQMEGPDRRFMLVPMDKEVPSSDGNDQG